MPKNKLFIVLFILWFWNIYFVFVRVITLTVNYKTVIWCARISYIFKVRNVSKSNKLNLYNLIQLKIFFKIDFYSFSFQSFYFLIINLLSTDCSMTKYLIFYWHIFLCVRTKKQYSEKKIAYISFYFF